MPNGIRDFSDPGYNHGTLGGYKKGCRCYDCRRARADNDLRLRGVDKPRFTFLKGMPLDHSQYPHGTLRGYRYCKCEPCRAANAAHKMPFNEQQRQSQEFRERQRQLNRAYKDTEHGRAKRRAHNATRKAAMRGIECSDDKRLIEAIYAACPSGHEVDHIVPLARGGKHEPDNLQYLPAWANNAKRTRTDTQLEALAVRWQELVEPSTTIPQGSRAKRPEVPRAS